MKKIFYSIIFILIYGMHTTVFAITPASLFITKQVPSITEGDTVTLDVKVSSLDQPINAVSGTITFPQDMLSVVSVSTAMSILTTWIPQGPAVQRNKIIFQGVVPNPGYRGSGGLILHVTFQTKRHGNALVAFSDGSILANDGHGTNILGSLKSLPLEISGVGSFDVNSTKPFAFSSDNPQFQGSTKPVALPVITEYSDIDSADGSEIYLKGKGEPNLLTKIAFEDVSHKSFGEEFMSYVQSKKKRLSDVFIKNNNDGLFEYIAPKNLTAGVYNATPFLVDEKTNSTKPGFGVQLLVSDSPFARTLVLVIDALILLVPIIGLLMIIYFISLYFSGRIRNLKLRMKLEEEKIKNSHIGLKDSDSTLGVR